MKRHEAYEALAGAIALGEAGESERARFAAHAAGCPACASLAPRDGELPELVRRAHEAENWRPDVAGGLLRRAREGRRARLRFTFGALSYAVVLSLVVNVALASGAGSWLRQVLAPPVTAPAEVASQPIELESRAAPAASRPAKRVERAARVAARVRPRAAVVAAARAPADDSLARVPDVLAGLGLGSESAERSVAFEDEKRCRPEFAAPHDAEACPPSNPAAPLP